jgi:hypothetical protein
MSKEQNSRNAPRTLGTKCDHQSCKTKHPQKNQNVQATHKQNKNAKWGPRKCSVDLFPWRAMYPQDTF